LPSITSTSKKKKKSSGEKRDFHMKKGRWGNFRGKLLGKEAQGGKGDQVSMIPAQKEETFRVEASIEIFKGGGGRKKKGAGTKEKGADKVGEIIIEGRTKSRKGHNQGGKGMKTSVEGAQFGGP